MDIEIASFRFSEPKSIDGFNSGGGVTLQLDFGEGPIGVHYIPIQAFGFRQEMWNTLDSVNIFEVIFKDAHAFRAFDEFDPSVKEIAQETSEVAEFEKSPFSKVFREYSKSARVLADETPIGGQASAFASFGEKSSEVTSINSVNEIITDMRGILTPVRSSSESFAKKNSNGFSIVRDSSAVQECAENLEVIRNDRMSFHEVYTSHVNIKETKARYSLYEFLESKGEDIQAHMDLTASMVFENGPAQIVSTRLAQEAIRVKRSIIASGGTIS